MQTAVKDPYRRVKLQVQFANRSDIAASAQCSQDHDERGEVNRQRRGRHLSGSFSRRHDGAATRQITVMKSPAPPAGALGSLGELARFHRGVEPVSAAAVPEVVAVRSPRSRRQPDGYSTGVRE